MAPNHWARIRPEHKTTWHQRKFNFEKPKKIAPILYQKVYFNLAINVVIHSSKMQGEKRISKTLCSKIAWFLWGKVSHLIYGRSNWMNLCKRLLCHDKCKKCKWLIQTERDTQKTSWRGVDDTTLSIFWSSLLLLLIITSREKWNANKKEEEEKTDKNWHRKEMGTLPSGNPPTAWKAKLPTPNYTTF